MKRILHVSCSPRGQAAESHRLAQKIIGFLLQKEPTAVLVNRVIGGGAISHVDETTRLPNSRPRTYRRRARSPGLKSSLQKWRVQILWSLELPCITSPSPPR